MILISSFVVESSRAVLQVRERVTSALRPCSSGSPLRSRSLLRDGTPPSAGSARGPGPTSPFEAVAVGRLLLGPEHPLVDIPVEVVDAEGRDALRHGASREALIELLQLGLALRVLHARGVLEELVLTLPVRLVDVALG